jgi:hypothetical protein
VTCVKLAAGNSGTPVVVALRPDSEPSELPPGVEVVATGLEKDVTVPVLPGAVTVVSLLSTTLPLSVLVEAWSESVGKGRLGMGAGISEVGILMVGRETAPETDDVKLNPILLLRVVPGGISESVGRDTDAAVELI